MTEPLKRRLTKTLVENLPPNSAAWDSDVQGFLVRSRGRAVTFQVTYRANGRQRWYTLGRFGVLTVEQARQQAKAVLGLVAQGQDPSATKEASRKAPTVQECAQSYLTKHIGPRLKPKTQRQYQDLLEQIILPRLGGLKMQNLTRQDVARLHEGLNKTPAQANRALAVISGLCNWAERHGYREDGTNPCRHVKKYREKPRDRFLSDAELARLAEALRVAEQGEKELHQKQIEAQKQGIRLGLAERPSLQAPFMAVNAIRLLLFTGARLSEILTLKWSYVDFENALLRLPDSKTGAKVIHLNGPALQVLQQLGELRMADNPHVIAGEKRGARLIGLQKIWERIRRYADLEDVRLHDLRHSYASIAVAAGFSLTITGKLLGHTQAATTQRYAHLADNPLRTANNAIGQRLSVLMGERRDDGKLIKLASSEHILFTISEDLNFYQAVCSFGLVNRLHTVHD